MNIIKLNAIDSTNTYLKNIVAKALPEDYTVVVTKHQSKGRGQMGTSWSTEADKNLIVSVFRQLGDLDIIQQFYISMVVALAIHDALKVFQIPDLNIKWPNDILSGDKKLCGILIENSVKKNGLLCSVIGFGINVNQKYFQNLPKATSMTNVTGIIFDKDEVLSIVLNRLKLYFELLESKQLPDIKLAYETFLFRKNKPSTFIYPNKEKFSGIIKGITDKGKLRVWTEDDIIKLFDFKEVALLY